MTNNPSMSLEVKIGIILPKLLLSNGLTLRALSKRANVPYSTLQEWTSNRTPKNPIQVQKVANCLGVTMHFLLFGEDDPQSPISKIVKEEFFSGTFEITIKRVKT